ncbi:disulfide bond formation protein DsbA [Actinosynnema pretiosum]|uniref:Disulfide bond formation protein DsbA n=1 Tax=Actinosynnema pretiosum TaxID=42197 RepID=A0A290Z528_9PSEU|nr:disulfide bond formation protein DsbA [Actinosynnema pretiosum]
MPVSAVRVEVWSDIVCPWCYIGKRRFESALAGFDGEVEVEWRSFQLDPNAPVGEFLPTPEHLSAKMGASREQVEGMMGQVTAVAAEVGLEYDLVNSVSLNTFDAHRVLHLAKSHGLGTVAHERLMRANLVEARTLDTPTLVELAAGIGVPAQETERVLAGDEYAHEVREDFAQARRYGVSGVPFFVLNSAYGVSGAQPAEVFAQALRQAAQG